MTLGEVYSAHQGVEHDDMNLICLGARVVGCELAQDLVRAFLAAQFSGGERHRRRLAKVAAMEGNETRDANGPSSPAEPEKRR